MFTLVEAIQAINGRKEFAVNQREYGTVVDYNIEMTDTFVGRTEAETTILLNLRGTIFDDTGKIIRLAYHKFKNLNQSPEYQESQFDLREPHQIQEKLDGSMIAPFKVGASWEFGTRAGITDVSRMASAYYIRMPVNQQTAYNQYIERCLSQETTPIFEYCSRENRVVIDYPVSRLVLTGLRCNRTGAYLPLVGVDSLIEVVKAVSFRSGDSLKYIAEQIALLQDSEGIVIKFDTGRMVKIKAELYCLQHRTLDQIRQEKDVLRLILTGKLDDVLPLLSPTVKVDIQKYSDAVLANVKHCEHQLRTLFLEYKRICENRKAFAALASNNRLSGVLFSWYSNKPLTLSEVLVNYCTTQTKVDEMRWVFNTQFINAGGQENA
ncbi:RNA ligase A [uncultured Caudovirales phage]|uniref:RNA ligase A n=1 Tax=uncultured Caudovirales phage TaxID=2100421 RepID=A0A6J5L7A2_9CAUD|nr:RNA ligase A [uncultured Caudovirales phage]